MPAHLRRFNEPGHVHFWTISCYRRLGFFHHDDMKTIVVAALKRLQGKFGICLVGLGTAQKKRLGELVSKAGTEKKKKPATTAAKRKRGRAKAAKA